MGVRAGRFVEARLGSGGAARPGALLVLAMLHIIGWRWLAGVPACATGGTANTESLASLIDVPGLCMFVPATVAGAMANMSSLPDVNIHSPKLTILC